MSRQQSRCIFYCYDWILEFQAYEMWRVLTNEAPECSSEALLSAATGLIEQMTHLCDTRDLPRIKEVIFVSLISLLIKLRDHSGELDSDKEDHIFATIPKMVEDLIGYCTGCQSATDLGTKALLETNILNIYTLCRRGQYDLAKKAFEEVVDEIDKGTNQKISAILNATNKPHRFLQENCISDYMATMTRFLEAVYNNTKPIILKLAEELTNGGKQEYRGAKCDYGPQTERLLQTDMNPVNEEDMARKLKKAQQKFQNNFIQRVSPNRAVNESECNSSDDEEESSHTSCGTRAQMKDRSSACTPRKDHGEKDSEESIRRRERGKQLVRKRRNSPTDYQKEDRSRSSTCTPPRKDRGYGSRPNLSPRRSVAQPATRCPSEPVSDSEDSELETEGSDAHRSGEDKNFLNLDRHGEKNRHLDRKRQHSPTARQQQILEPSTSSKDQCTPMKAHTPHKSRSYSDAPELSGDTTDNDSDQYNRNLESRVGPLNRRRLHTYKPPKRVKPPSHNKHYAGRRLWTAKETEEFYMTVQKFGVGNWGQIQIALKTDRTNVQLKDKWRNIIQHQYDRLCKRFGPVIN